MLRQLAKQLLRATLAERVEMPRAQRQLMSAPGLSPLDVAMLEQVSLRVDPNEEMYRPFRAEHYLNVGLSTVHAIDAALKVAGPMSGGVQNILDFPCGHGRVMRFLRLRFPRASIYAAELETTGLEFCRVNFDAKPVPTSSDFDALTLITKFDLIWCGSLLTHTNEASTAALLRFFHRHLMPAGICVFTTHGDYPAENLERGLHGYGLPTDAQKTIVAQYREKGFGFGAYAGQTTYGISLATHDRMKAIAAQAGAWKELYFTPRGWDNHQDIHAYQRAAD